jgi:ATP-dependent DNA helicase RecG
MEQSTVVQILDRLKERCAGELESQTLEVKGWCRDEKDLAREISEATVCLANGDGGLVLVGVDDKKVGDAAITRCPYPYVTADWIKARIREFTRPPIACVVMRLGELIPNLTAVPAGDLFIIELTKTNLASGHQTHKRVSLIRANNECRTQYLADRDDYTDVWLNNVTYECLADSSITAAIKSREAHLPEVKRLGHRPIDHLTETGLLRLKEDAYVAGPDAFTASAAALILLGKENRIKAEIPSAETVIAVETPITSPLTGTNWQNVVESVEKAISFIEDQLAGRHCELPRTMIMELILNAYLHRCYRTRGAVQIRIRQDEIEIQNPGGLLGSLTTESLIYEPPIYRNFKLADAARQFGYCEKAGTGIDKVYHLAIVDGLDLPIFYSAGNSFGVIIKTRRDEPFAKFIQSSAGSLNLSLPDLVVIRALRTYSEADKSLLIKLAQRPLDYMEGALRDLERRNIIYKTRTNRYRLTETIISEMAKYGDSDQLTLFDR